MTLEPTPTPFPSFALPGTPVPVNSTLLVKVFPVLESKAVSSVTSV